MVSTILDISTKYTFYLYIIIGVAPSGNWIAGFWQVYVYKRVSGCFVKGIQKENLKK